MQYLRYHWCIFRSSQYYSNAFYHDSPCIDWLLSLLMQCLVIYISWKILNFSLLMHTVSRHLHPLYFITKRHTWGYFEVNMKWGWNWLVILHVEASQDFLQIILFVKAKSRFYFCLYKFASLKYYLLVLGPSYQTS